MELVDTHCHIHFKDFGVDLNEVLRSAKAAGVSRMVCVGTTLEDSASAAKLAQQHHNLWAAAGVHPHDSTGFLKQADGPQELSQILGRPRVVAVGEIGLDYFKNYASRQDQLKAFTSQLEIGLSTNLPFIFHVRDAWSDFWAILDEYKIKSGVVHSFSSGTLQLEKALSKNLYIGLNGIMTFTKDQAQLEAAKRVPADRVLLETDAPFLAPRPYRGAICEPKHAHTTAEFLAELRGESLEKLATATTQNAIQLFNLK